MVRTIAIGLFLLCFVFGLWLAQRRPLWCDEVFSQVTQVQALSYREIWFERKAEPNRSPLFYVVQKIVCDVFHFRLPQGWPANQELSDVRAQFVMRLAPNVFMSLSLAVLFYFFARHYSLGIGFYAFLTGLSSVMVWDYWIEARHYALWFLLTTLQTIVFLRILHNRQPHSSQWKQLALIHGMLAFTNILSVIQIAGASVFLWIFKQKKFNDYIWAAVVPLLICAMYYDPSLSSSFVVKGNPFGLEETVVHREWMYVFLIYGIFLGFGRNAQHKHFVLFVTALIVASSGMVAYYKFAGHGDGRLFAHRYLLYLVPITIMGLTCLVADIFRVFKHDRWICTMLTIILGGLLLIRLLRTYMLVLGIFHWNPPGPLTFHWQAIVDALRNAGG